RKLHRLPSSIYASTGYEYSFTVCARQRGTPFVNPSLAEAIIESLLWTRNRYRWQLFCYCLMPDDHLHFVCRLQELPGRLMNAGARGTVPEGVLEQVARFKSFTTQQSWKFGGEGELWHRSSYDRVLDLERPFERVVEYVLENPVRAGLVEH